MEREFTLTVPPGKRKERLDRFLTHHVENASRSKVQQAIRNGAVTVNGHPVRASHRVAPGETIRVSLPQPPPPHILPEDIPLDILYEDEDLVVVNKPAGMVTHPAHGNYTGTLVNALLHRYSSLSSPHSTGRPGIVHRLDKDTSGILVVARNEAAHANLARQFARRTVEREYQAIVWGTFQRDRGTIDAQLGRSKSDRKKITVVRDGKSAVTEYRVLRQFPYLALLALSLHTGRTHQIRVHLAHIHHPVFGDPTYNGRRIVAGPGTARQRADVHRLLGILPRQALHARTLGFVHPSSGKRVTFESSLPPDFQAVLGILQES